MPTKTRFDKDLEKDMKSPTFRKAYEKESTKLRKSVKMKQIEKEYGKDFGVKGGKVPKSLKGILTKRKK